jgi:hypothetical protein
VVFGFPKGLFWGVLEPQYHPSKSHHCVTDCVAASVTAISQNTFIPQNMLS